MGFIAGACYSICVVSFFAPQAAQGSSVQGFYPQQGYVKSTILPPVLLGLSPLQGIGARVGLSSLEFQSARALPGSSLGRIQRPSCVRISMT